MEPRSLTQRLEARSQISTVNGWTNPEGVWSACREWTGALWDGYGRTSHDGKSVRVHRLSYELNHGRIPNGVLVCHRCDNRSCFNPDHLFLGSHNDNQTDMVEKGRSTRGETNPRSKLTEGQVAAILADPRSQNTIAGDFGISRRTVRDIKTGKRWQWLGTRLAA